MPNDRLSLYMFALLCASAGALVAKVYSAGYLHGCVAGADVITAQLRAHAAEDPGAVSYTITRRPAR